MVSTTSVLSILGLCSLNEWDLQCTPQLLQYNDKAAQGFVGITNRGKTHQYSTYLRPTELYLLLYLQEDGCQAISKNFIRLAWALEEVISEDLLIRLVSYTHWNTFMVIHSAEVWSTLMQACSRCSRKAVETNSTWWKTCEPPFAREWKRGSSSRRFQVYRVIRQKCLWCRASCQWVSFYTHYTDPHLRRLYSGNLFNSAACTQIKTEQKIVRRPRKAGTGLQHALWLINLLLPQSCKSQASSCGVDNRAIDLILVLAVARFNTSVLNLASGSPNC